MNNEQIDAVIMRCKALQREFKKRFYIERERLEDISFAPCGEHEWQRLLENEFTMEALLPRQGLGAIDQHYALEVRIPARSYEEEEYHILVQTGADDVWNYNNPQFLAFLDDQIINGLDMNHQDIALTGLSNEEHSLKLFMYCSTNLPDIFLRIDLAKYNPRIKDLYYDLQIPLEILEFLEKDDINRSSLASILFSSLQLLDTRNLEGQSFYDSIPAVRAYLRKHFYDVNWDDKPVTIHSIGSTHIDVAWLWTVMQTREKTLRSLSSVLYLMKRYPEYQFMFSQAQLYSYLKQDMPDLFEAVKEAHAANRWEVEGAAWVEPDTNLPSGESLVRQILYGKAFFKKEFAIDQKVLWLPDAFGFTAALPQIMKKSGIQYFSSTKIGWNDTNQFPHDSFYWEGIDGSKILTHFITTKDYIRYPNPTTEKNFSTTYNGTMEIKQLLGAWQRYQEKECSKDILQVFGWGDGGGGPTSDMLERQRRLTKPLPKVGQVQTTKIADFFEILKENMEASASKPTWTGEIPLEYHRATLTTMAEIKKANRKIESYFRNVEFLFALLRMHDTFDTRDDKEKLHSLWQIVLQNQFHDILPGTAIREVYDQCARDYDYVFSELEAMKNRFLARLGSLLHGGLHGGIHGEQAGILQFNPYLFDLVDREGLNPIPAASWKYAGQADKLSNTYEHTYDSETHVYQNQFMRVEFLTNGQVKSIYDLELGKEYLQSGEHANRFRIFEDYPLEYDAWNTEKYVHDRFWEIDQHSNLACAVTTDRRIELKHSVRFSHSELEQTITLYANSRRIDFSTKVLWHESHLFLKVDFPLAMSSDFATCDIQFGNLKRSLLEETSQERAAFEVLAHKWVDISDKDFGCALLNDCKYGFHLRKNLIRMSLLRSSKYPNEQADMGEHVFRYSLYPHKGDWKAAKVDHEAISFNHIDLEYALIGQSNAIPSLPTHFQLLHCKQENILMESVKLAEDKDDIIVRLYENHGKKTKAKFHFSEKIHRVDQCSLLEEIEERVVLTDAQAQIEFSPYEIKTLRLQYE